MTGTENRERQRRAFIDGRRKFAQYKVERAALDQYRVGGPAKVLPMRQTSRAGWSVVAALKSVRNFFSRRNG